MFGWNNTTSTITRRAVEATGAYDGGLAALTHGLMAGTRVASNLGWRDVAALSIGDMVLTFDNGMQTVTEIRRTVMWLDGPETDEALWPFVVPVDALGNRVELVLLPDQGVLVESDATSDMHGDPFAIVPAIALEGVRGIARCAPQQQIELLAIYFDDEQVVYAEGGALLHCPTCVPALDALLSTQPSAYDVLGTRDAVFLAECIAIEDHIVANTAWVDGQSVFFC